MAVRLQCTDAQGSQVGIFLISAYAPVGAAPQKDWDEFFAAMNQVLSNRTAGDVTVVGADIKSSLGRAPYKERHDAEMPYFPFGSYGPYYRNNSGSRFLTWMQTNGLMAASSFFKPRRTAFMGKPFSTWMHPCSRRTYQLDHFLVAGADMKRARI